MQNSLLQTDTSKLDSYQRFQLERYGNILPTREETPEEVYENGIIELNRLADWIEDQAQLTQL